MVIITIMNRIHDITPEVVVHDQVRNILGAEPLSALWANNRIMKVILVQGTSGVF